VEAVIALVITKPSSRTPEHRSRFPKQEAKLVASLHHAYGRKGGDWILLNEQLPKHLKNE
jgi:hypothetical protein